MRPLGRALQRLTFFVRPGQLALLERCDLLQEDGRTLGLHHILLRPLDLALRRPA